MLLNGEWSLKIGTEDGKTIEIPGKVPGCAHTDLQRAGILGDIFYRKNAEDGLWVENADVTYERNFYLEKVEENTFLTFEGLDTYAEIFLNGEKCGENEDMFVSCAFPADGLLREGENTVKVAFRSPVREVEGLPGRSGAFTTERLYTRRIQCTYGWDWVARFVTVGIWKDVRLEVRRPDRLAHIYVTTESINPYAAMIGVSADFEGLTGDGEAEFFVTDPEGKAVWTKKRRLLAEEKGADHVTIRENISLAAPKLWYPAGYGEQPLYTLTVRAAGEEKKQNFGIRTVEILELTDAPGSREAEKAAEIKKYEHLTRWDKNEDSSSFILLINGKRIFCRGANWVPCEPFVSGETDEKIEKLVKLAREGNYNMLRVWGGGIFEHEAFYAACDREGILVTQDFLMACGDYPEEDDAFIEKLKAEAREGAYLLRNHPSLVWWSGDNENAVNGDENMPSYNGRRAALEAIGPVLRELDPARRFLPSSPYGGKPYASAVKGTTHNTQFLGDFFAWIREGDFSDYQSYFARYLARFTAEQPAMGLPYVSSLRKFMTDEDIFGEDTSVSEYHTKNNPGLGEVTLYGYCERMAEGMFGKFKDGHDRVKKMQYLQIEWIRLSLELFRRNAWFSSGIIYWMFDDCWPAANGWSMVDYYAAPKPGFYAFKRAASPMISSAAKEGEEVALYLSNAGDERKTGRVRLYEYDILSGAEKTVFESFFTADAGEAKEIFRFRPESCDTRHVWLSDLTSDDGLSDRAFCLPCRWGDMAFEEGEAEIVREDESTVTVRAAVTLPALLLDVPYRVNENSMFMKKGEEITLRKIFD